MMDFETLRLRSALLQKARLFFLERQFLEVETPIASSEVIPESHIDPVSCKVEGVYLQASPELAMKRLLCQGSGPIFQVTHCFRDNERGDQHRPEFTMFEWYRPGDDMHSGIELLEAFFSEVTGITCDNQTSYREAFIRYLGVDPFQSSESELYKIAMDRSEGSFQQKDWQSATRDQLLDYLLTSFVEPQLGSSGAEIIYHYPASQSALACISEDENENQVAERFELYAGGLELANGYHELTDADELAKRLKTVNQIRLEEGREPLPIPRRLLDDMRQKGMPASAGVALGFDRLVMLVTGKQSIADVISCDELG